VRDLDQQSSTVTGVGVTSAGTAVREVDEYLDSLDDNVVRLLAFDTGDEAYPAGVTFVAWIVESLRAGKSVTLANFTHLYSLPFGCGTRVRQLDFRPPRLPELV
jgi:hypothetical protein